MPELQMDVAVANRFISSLSKSLQALCHGCMDFDSGIEIVGYINVNIDCGSKVDYVLNEKVLKSTTNSMTFVSNSFLARKEQQKQTRDGMCSPIRELNQPPAVMSSFQNRARGYLHGLHSRNAAPVSHSYVHHGPQKRSWTGMERDSRMSPKKSRDGRPSLHEPGSTAQRTHSNPMSSSFSQNPADPNFRWPQTSAQVSDINTDSHEEVNIKKELLESDSGKEIDQSEQDQSQTDHDANDNTDQVSRVPNIKCDPDASTAIANDETAADEPANVADSDYKGTFLEPSTSEKNEDVTEQNRSQTDTNDDSESTAVGSVQQSEDAAEEVPSENVTAGSDMPAEFDEAGEEGTYPHSVYSDAGEGSSDAGQFEVIEIEDEDEDVQAMFGEPRVNGSFHKRKQFFRAAQGGSLQRPSLYHPQMLPCDSFETESLQSQNSSVEICSICRIALPVGLSYRRHFVEAHSQEATGTSLMGAEPFTCEVCQRGFISKERLRQHSSVHDSSFVTCFICDAKFKHKKNIKRHMESSHGLKRCNYCMALFKVGDEFNSHIICCDGTLKPSETQWKIV